MGRWPTRKLWKVSADYGGHWPPYKNFSRTERRLMIVGISIQIPYREAVTMHFEKIKGTRFLASVCAVDFYFSAF
jgi:hypothetical protein